MGGAARQGRQDVKASTRDLRLREEDVVLRTISGVNIARICISKPGRLNAVATVVS